MFPSERCTGPKILSILTPRPLPANNLRHACGAHGTPRPISKGCQQHSAPGAQPTTSRLHAPPPPRPRRSLGTVINPVEVRARRAASPSRGRPCCRSGAGPHSPPPPSAPQTLHGAAPPALTRTGASASRRAEPRMRAAAGPGPRSRGSGGCGAVGRLRRSVRIIMAAWGMGRASGSSAGLVSPNTVPQNKPERGR